MAGWGAGKSGSARALALTGLMLPGAALAQISGPRDPETPYQLPRITEAERSRDCGAAANPEDIVVCGRREENARHRLPPRTEHFDWTGPEQSVSRERHSLYELGDTGIGSCSTVGPGGFTGCLGQLINQARAERQGADEVDWNALIEKARQERLGRIDAESEAIDREQRQPR